MPDDGRLHEIIQKCNDLIESVRGDCVIPSDKFCGYTANVLRSIRENELDRIIDVKKQLHLMLQEEERI